MKKIKYISKLAIIAATCFVGLFSSCKDNEADLILPRLFRPVNFNVELNKTEATFSWAVVDSAVSYTLQVSTDSIEFSNPIIDTTITEKTFVYEFAGKTQFFARLRANAATETKNSKFNVLPFKTPAENLFEGYVSAMSGWQAMSIKWRPGANVTDLILKDANGSTQTINIQSANIATGEVEVTSIPSSTYKVEIYNGSILRGSVNVIVEGDVYVVAGQDLPTAINNATDGQVIVLAPGITFPMGGGTYRFTKNVKVRGANPGNLPVLCMTAGSPTTTSSMFGFADASIIGSVKFENIDFTGYCDNNSASTKIGYLFNNNLLTTVGSLQFNNCKLHNFGNTPMRVQAAKNQVIDTLIFNKCTIYDIGFSSTYAIVNSNSADFINNITFKNCTVYNFKGSLVLRQNQSFSSINISNCTINQGMQDGASTRFLIDANNATVSGSGITISNCVFGKTSSTAEKGAAGIRTTGNLSITGSYYTSDFVDETMVGAVSYSQKGKMTAYSGASTDLWTDPVNGNFTLKATNFAGKGLAGDLRWY